MYMCVCVCVGVCVCVCVYEDISFCTAKETFNKEKATYWQGENMWKSYI